MTIAPTSKPTKLRSLPSAHIEAVRALFIQALVKRGHPRQDAEDVAQDLLEKMARRPEYFASRLAQLDQHRGYFIKMALNGYLMRLRSEQRRRAREQRQWRLAADRDTAGAAPSLGRVDGLDGQAVMALAEQAPLTARQRQYLAAVLVQNLSVDDIAEVTDTSPRAVRAVLSRAVAVLRRHLLRPSA